MKVPYRVALGSVVSLLAALGAMAPAMAAPGAGPGTSAAVADSASPSTPVASPSGSAGSPSPQPSPSASYVSPSPSPSYVSPSPSYVSPPPSPSTGPSGSTGPSVGPSDSTGPSPTPSPSLTGGIISGAFTHADGSPVPWTSVTVINVDTWQNIYGSTDASGNYTVAGLSTGSYRVMFQIPGTSLIQYVPQKTDLYSGTAYPVTVGAVTTVNDTALPTGTVTGHFTDHTGQPVSALVSVADVVSGLTESTTTDGSGAYTVPVFAGTYTVEFIYADNVQQYAYQQTLTGKPSRFTVAGGATVVVDDTALPSGSIAGVITDFDGSPLAGGQISLSGTSNGEYLTATVGADGSYRIDNVPAGTYTMRIATGVADDSRYQWVSHTTNQWQAQVLTVTADQVTTVDDTMVATGTLVVSAVDDVTGQPVADACAYLSEGGTNRWVCATGTNPITITGVPAGDAYDLSVSADGRLNTDKRGVTVVANQSTSLSVPLARIATITATVVDAATGKPVPGVCVYVVTAPNAAPTEGLYGCSDSTGALSVGYLSAGTYRLFAWPRDGVHGEQWVGTSGGTGDVNSAAKITLAEGATAAAPTIRLDPAGSISGTVTDARTGAPLVAGVSVVPVISNWDHAGFLLGTTSDPATGTYTLTGVGPYNWPVEFASTDSTTDAYLNPLNGKGHAWQWSGGAPDRQHARPVHVTAGGTATANARLSAGTLISGKVVDSTGAPVHVGDVSFVNATTGDAASDGIAIAPDGTFSAQVATGQPILVSTSSPPARVVYWYPGTPDRGSARPVQACGKSVTITITVPAS